MPSYRYRALNSNGELVSGAIAAAAPGDVAQRIERLGLVLVDNVTLEEGGGSGRSIFSVFNKPKAEDVTIFTRDLALLLRAGARINDGLELLAADRDFGRLRPVVADIRSHVIAGESFAEALSRHEALFPAMYVALIRVGEASGSLDQVLQVLADERSRTEALKRRLGDAIRYPVFVLGAAGCVLLFFLTFVLPQFASVLQDFGAKVDPIILTFLNLSTLLRNNSDAVLAVVAIVIAGSWLSLRQDGVRRGIGATAVEVRECRRLVDENTAGQICRQVHTDVQRDPFGGVEHLVVARVHGCGEGAAPRHRTPEDLKAVLGGIRGDDERDGAEPLLAVGLLAAGVQLHDERGTYDRVAERRMRDRLRVEDDDRALVAETPQLGRGADAGHRATDDDGSGAHA